MNVKMLLGFGALTVSRALFASQSGQHEEAAWARNSRPRVEIIGSVAVGHVFRFEDRGFGTHFNAGAGVEVAVWRGLRAGAEVNRTFGLDPQPAQCRGIYPAPGQPAFACTGSALVGVSDAMAASFTAAYYFGNRRMQPYVVGGVSVLRAREYTATYVVHTDGVEIRENSSSGTGVGMTFGAGLRATLTRRLSIRPEFRFYDGTALSAVNLSQFRLSVGVAYGW
jgi:hypothetical protein